MDELPTWKICSVVTAIAVIGSVFVFLLCLGLALLLRWVTGVREPPALVIVAARKIGRYLRRRLAWGAVPSAPELVQCEPSVAVAPGSSPLM
jgi:hypothetical protein